MTTEAKDQGLLSLLKRWHDKPTEHIGLALGGGAILGAAHIGILKALEENKVRISSISGTSIGAFVAALYAFGTSAREIEDIALSMDWMDISSVSLSRFGLLSNEKLGESFKRTVGDVTFKDAEIPLAVVATNISDGMKVVLKEGNVAEAIMASTCVPGVFIPMEIDGELLVDGGLVENVPVSPLREFGADKVVGVDLNAKRKYQRPENILDVMVNALDIALDNATRLQVDATDVLIAPELTSYARTDTRNVRKLIDDGYQAASKMLEKITSA